MGRERSADRDSVVGIPEACGSALDRDRIATLIRMFYVRGGTPQAAISSWRRFPASRAGRREDIETRLAALTRALSPGRENGDDAEDRHVVRSPTVDLSRRYAARNWREERTARGDKGERDPRSAARMTSRRRACQISSELGSDFWIN